MAIDRASVTSLAEKFTRQGRLKEAISQYLKLLEDGPSEVRTLNLLGDLYRRNGEIQRALSCFTKIAEQYRDRGFAQKAIAMYKKVAKLDATSVETREQLALLYVDQGLLRDAQQNLRDAAGICSRAGDSEHALELESRALELCPDDWRGQSRLAERLRDAGEIERSVSTFLRAAEGLEGEGQIDTALTCCRSAMEVAPLDPVPIAHLVRLLMASDRVDEAVAELERRLQADPGTPHLLALLGEALLKKGDLARAREALDAARGSAFAAGDVNFQVSRLRLDLSEGGLEKAAPCLEQVVGVLRESGQHSAARDLVRDCLEMDPESDLALGLLAGLCAPDVPDAPDMKDCLEILVQRLGGSKAEAALPSILLRLQRERPDDPEIRERLQALSVAAAPASTAAAPATQEAAGGKTVDELMTLEGEDGSLVDEDFVAEHLTEADVFVKYGLLPRAAAHLQQVIQRYPRTLIAHRRLIEIYKEVDDRNGVVRHCVMLAEACRQTGELDEAQQAIRDARQLEPENASLRAMERALQSGSFLPVYRAAASPVAGHVAAPSPPSDPPPSPVAAAVPVAGDQAVSVATVVDALPDEEIIELEEDGPAPAPEEAAAVPPAATGQSPSSPGPGVEMTQEAETGQEGAFFDLASAIESELAREEEKERQRPVIADQPEPADPATGIREALQDLVATDDHQTHYQLGIAFKEMGLLNEAIGEFQQASRDPENFLACCSMLGLCFREKGMPRIAETWYRRGLDSASASQGDQEERVGLLYDQGTLYAESGDTRKARECFMEVFSLNAQYRDVSSRLENLEEQSPAPGRGERR
ncbi:MAG: tetratricopeptide repeat protein [Acidobacteriota bacterium]